MTSFNFSVALTIATCPSNLKKKLGKSVTKPLKNSNQMMVFGCHEWFIKLAEW